MPEVAQNELLRQLPAVDEVLSRPAVEKLARQHPRSLVVDAVRLAVRRAREMILGGAAKVDVGEVEVAAALESLVAPRLRRVINASGVVLHTNLGRAPLAARAIERIEQVARGYCNLELDLETGSRGSRYAPVEELLRDLTGAEAAVVVNNNAGAVLLVLSALAAGREVIVSRGEAVEIGGGFRIPDVMRQSGCTLVEVGTTNKTRLADYERAITDRTALLLKVHQSNFAIVGFTEDVAVRELAELASLRKVPVFEDLGSGCLLDRERLGLDEPTARRSATHADLVSFSGDKLLGGPQCGIIVGKADLVRRVREHPLNRALRVDKLTVAALEATLELYRQGAEEQIPVVRLLREELGSVAARAETLKRALAELGLASDVVETTSAIGGGAQPLTELPSRAVRIRGFDPEKLAGQLRTGSPSIVGRVADGGMLLDVRCVGADEVSVMAQAVGRAALALAVPEGQG